MTADQAATYYAQLHPETGAISDEELDNVSGGCTEFDYREAVGNWISRWCYNDCGLPD